MIANYHTHTWRCNHAQPGENRYVRAAMERGLKILGFSDHTPYPFPRGHLSTFRMRVAQLPGYCRCIQELQKKYAGKIQIEIGLEAEYYPRYFPELTAILRVANGLDRSHKQKFRDIKTLLKDNQLVITAGTPEDITLERGLFTERAAFFEEVFSVKLVIRQKKFI